MTRILISGIYGAMGRVLLSAIEEREGLAVVAGVDQTDGEAEGIPVFSSFDNVSVDIDVVIDFSNPAILDNLTAYCKRTDTPAVICTTGFSAEQEARVKKLSESIPVFRSANMSLGVNLIANLAKTASKVLGGAFDIEIVEKHHRKKVDAPSGTAMMLANEINAANEGRFEYVFERESVRRNRGDNELGIHAVRGGTIVGEHEIIFAGPDEVISLSHSAMSKGVFATGAISAAIFLVWQQPGLYSMDDLFE